jgi:hypothetical protein
VLLFATGWEPIAAQDPDNEAGSAPRPPQNVKAVERLNDRGDGVIVTWELSPDDVAGARPPRVDRYDVLRRVGPEEEFQVIGSSPSGMNELVDRAAQRGQPHFYRVVAVSPEDAASAPTPVVGPVVPELEWFDTSQGWFGILLLLVGGAVVYYIAAARRGGQIRVRRIPGLEAVTEAVGRATEMGRSCLFVPGIQDINDIQTIAGLTILSRVSQIAAEYDARVEVPTARSLVMTTARETVQSSYAAAGRPDAYREDDIYYLTDEQFGYVAAVAGTMTREKPAACFYMGAFYAESLILAETGNGIGAIQVAGTAQPSQLPFFVAACDYTLIGEEFLAASAYLSGEPQQLGSLRGQDFGKVLGALLLLIGCGLATAAAINQGPELAGAVDFLRNNILGNEGFLP